MERKKCEKCGHDLGYSFNGQDELCWSCAMKELARINKENNRIENLSIDINSLNTTNFCEDVKELFLEKELKMHLNEEGDTDMGNWGMSKYQNTVFVIIDVVLNTDNRFYLIAKNKGNYMDDVRNGEFFAFKGKINEDSKCDVDLTMIRIKAEQYIRGNDTSYRPVVDFDEEEVRFKDVSFVLISALNRDFYEQSETYGVTVQYDRYSGKYRLISKNSNVDTGFTYPHLGSRSGKYLVVCKNYTPDDRVNYFNHYGVMDEKLNIVIPEIYDDISVSGTVSGLFICKKDGKYTVLNHKNETVIKSLELEYGYVMFNGKYGEVSIDGKVGFVDKSLQFVIEPQYSKAIRYSNNYIPSAKLFIVSDFESGKVGAVNIKNKIVIPFEYGSIHDANGCFFMSADGDLYGDKSNACGVFDYKGNKIIDLEHKYSELKSPNKKIVYAESEHTNSTIIVFLAEKNRTIEISGYKLEPGKKFFETGFACVKDDNTGLYGIINNQGELTMPCSVKKPIKFDD